MASGIEKITLRGEEFEQLAKKLKGIVLTGEYRKRLREELVDPNLIREFNAWKVYKGQVARRAADEYIQTPQTILKKLLPALQHPTWATLRPLMDELDVRSRNRCRIPLGKLGRGRYQMIPSSAKLSIHRQLLDFDEEDLIDGRENAPMIVFGAYRTPEERLASYAGSVVIRDNDNEQAQFLTIQPLLRESPNSLSKTFGSLQTWGLYQTSQQSIIGARFPYYLDLPPQNHLVPFANMATVRSPPSSFPSFSDMFAFRNTGNLEQAIPSPGYKWTIPELKNPQAVPMIFMQIGRLRNIEPHKKQGEHDFVDDEFGVVIDLATLQPWLVSAEYPEYDENDKAIDQGVVSQLSALDGPGKTFTFARILKPTLAEMFTNANNETFELCDKTVAPDTFFVRAKFNADSTLSRDSDYEVSIAPALAIPGLVQLEAPRDVAPLLGLQQGENVRPTAGAAPLGLQQGENVRPTPGAAPKRPGT